MMLMKKRYEKPVIGELLYEAAPLLVGSHFREVEPEDGGGIDPGTEVNTGLSRNSVWDDDEEY